MLSFFVRTIIHVMSEDNKRPGRPKKKTPTTRFEMRLDVPMLEAWQVDAEKDGKSVAAWLKELGNKKAKYKEIKTL